MNIDIKYSDDKEFIHDLTLQMRLKNYIYNHFYLAYTISNIYPVYLLGGAIRDLIYAEKPKDLDFVVISHDKDFILDVFSKFNINYTFNKFYGFKFVYEGTSIDLWLTDDLFSSIEYNVDGLFFDLKSNSLISLTFKDFIDNGLKLINKENNIENGRIEKLKLFEKKYRGIK